MSEIELASLAETLEDDEIKTLGKLLEQAGVRFSSTAGDDVRQMIAKRVDEAAMTEFLDRLEAHDVAADIYIPVEFEGRLAVGEYRVASTQSLMEVMEELKDELDVEDEEEYEADDADEDAEEEEDEEEDEEEGAVIEAQLRHIWQLVSTGCADSIEKVVPLHLRV